MLSFLHPLRQEQCDDLGTYWVVPVQEESDGEVCPGNYQGAMDIISEYWGAMLDLGATTFWEDFHIDWTKNAARIDELVPEGKVDVHGAYGD